METGRPGGSDPKITADKPMAAILHNVVCRNATFGPDVSRTRLYPINNITEKGDTHAIARGKANLVLANPV